MPVKIAHDPLLAPGRHAMTLDRLHDVAVQSFPTSTRRPMLFAELSRLHTDLIDLGLVCELWVDGSFMTKKPEPDDIDLCYSAMAADFDCLEPCMQRVILNNLNGGKRYSPHLDTYICIRYLREDPRIRADTTDDWSEKWGVGWDDFLTGFAVIKLGETYVGHKLLA